MALPNTKKLVVAFRNLRKKGYLAKRNFWCCNTCAWYDLSDEEAKKAVFLTKQAEQSMRETGKVYLSWNGNGREIVQVFKDAGLSVEWNGSKGQKIVADLLK
jgi:hypothetical protein